MALPVGCCTTYSLVMKEMNSETHSCTVSFASLAIFALFGSAFFIILLMFAIGKNLSCSRGPSSSDIYTAIGLRLQRTDTQRGLRIYE